jgi:hypothetical protein
MRFVDVAPFFVAMLIGVAAGCLLRRWAWACLAFPLTHLLVSVLTGRAGEDLFTYVVPVNAVLGLVTVVGVVLGRLLRKRTRSGASTSS